MDRWERQQLDGATAWLEQNIFRIVGSLVDGHPDVACMVADSGATCWGLETFEPFDVEPSHESNRCRFSVTVNVAGNASEERFCMFNQARIALRGNVIRYHQDWGLDNVEVERIDRRDHDA